MSLALNYVFYKKAFIPLHELRLNPLELNVYPSQTEAKSTDHTPTFMYYGDSRALSWPFVKDSRYEFMNRAIGNQTSVQINARFEQHVAPHKPQIILFQMCVNDLKMIPLFPEKRQEIIDNCLSNTQSMVQKSHDMGAKVVLSTVFPLADVSLDRQLLGIKEQPIIEAINQVNQRLKSLQSENTLIFDSYHLLVGDDGKVDASYSHDWLHLSPAGYKHLNQHLSTFISKAFAES